MEKWVLPLLLTIFVSACGPLTPEQMAKIARDEANNKSASNALLADGSANSVSYDSKGTLDIQYLIQRSGTTKITFTLTRYLQLQKIETLTLNQADDSALFSFIANLMAGKTTLVGTTCKGTSSDSLSFAYAAGKSVQYTCPTAVDSFSPALGISSITQYVLNHL